MLQCLSRLHHSDNGRLDVKLSVLLYIVLSLLNFLRGEREREREREIRSAHSHEWMTNLPVACLSVEVL